VSTFATTIAAVYLPKLLWNRLDLGLWLPDQVASALRARWLTGLTDPEHHVFFLDPAAAVPASLIDAARTGDLPRIVGGAVVATAEVVVALWPAWICLLPLMILLARGHDPGRDLRRLTVILVEAVAGYVGLFAAGLAEPAQIRYWLVPLTLTPVIGLAAATRLLQYHRTRLEVVAAFAVIAAALAVSAVGFARQYPTVYGHAPPYPEAAVIALAEKLEPEQSVLLHTNRGLHYWVRDPSARVVSLKPHILVGLDRDRLGRLVADYRIGWAMVASPTSVAHLNLHGFRSVGRWGEVTLLQAPPATVGGWSPHDR
jgi:hypothetical protein